MSDNNSNYSDDHITLEQLIDDFYLHESEKIHDLYYDINRFCWFIDDMEFHDLFNFIINQRFSQYQNYTISASKHQLDYFELEYRDEINTTLFVLNNFLKNQNIKTYKKLKINYQDWFEFCYNFTMIKTPKHYEFELPEFSDDESSD
jgi:hypothetical protein